MPKQACLDEDDIGFVVGMLTNISCTVQSCGNTECADRVGEDIDRLIHRIHSQVRGLKVAPQEKGGRYGQSDGCDNCGCASGGE